MFSFIQSRIAQIIFTAIFITGTGFAATQPIIPQNIAGLLTKDGKPVTSQTLIAIDKDGKKTEVSVSPNNDGKFATSTNQSVLDILFGKAKDQTICAKDEGVIINGTIGCVPATTIVTNDSPETLKANPDKIKSSFAESDVVAFQQPAFSKAAKANGVSSTIINNLVGQNGTDGLAGLKGEKGDKGDNGSNGTDGKSGSNGQNGNSGNDGKNGTSGTSGKDGQSGSNGTSGNNGTNGQNGTSGNNGNDGSNGNQGAKGDKGDKGDPGSVTKGDTGADGATGPQGNDGATGPQGAQGVQGAQGIQGTSGVLSTTNDTNITGSLSGTNLTLGFTGQLSTARGGTGLSTIGTAGQVLAVNGAGTGLTYIAIPSAPVSSVFGRTGAITAQNGDYTSDQVTEGATNKYYTNARFDTAFSGKTTSNLAEGTNLYYTTTRANADFDSRLTAKSTTNLAEGANLYYTQARFDTAFSAKSTTNLSEGSNLYYTDARARNAFSAGAALAYNSSTGQFAFVGDTSNVPENGNLYYTQARFNTAFSGKTTDDLTQGGTNKYYSTSLFNTDFGTKTTTNLSEGSNLYYTDARARGALSVSGPLTYNTTTGLFGISAANGTTSGYLTAADWTTFNNKEGAIAAGTNAQYLRGDKTWQILDTANVPENGNLYYTQARFNSALSAKTTDNLTQGTTNKYYATSLFNTDFAAKSTSGLAEGSNLYYTDARSDARIVLQKGVASGLASLDATGKVPTSQLPAIAISNTYVVASQAAQTALTANIGDVAVRTDENKTYILQTTPASTFANWQELLTPGAPVISVNGQTGSVTLSTTNITEGVNLYYTDARARGAISGTGAVTYNATTGAIGDQLTVSTGLSRSGNDIAFTGTTTVVGEGANLYYTDARARAAISATGPVNYNSTTGAISINQANASTAGYLSSADWNTFNNKENALTFTGNGLFSRTSNTITGATCASTGQILKWNGSAWSCTADNGLTSLANGKILIGDAGNLPSEQTVSGDATLSNVGVLTLANSAVNSAKIADGSIVDGDISATAGIGYSKLSLANSIVNGDIVNSTITNNKLANSTISFATGTSGTTLNVSGSPVALGGTVTLNIPLASTATVTGGLLSNTDYTTFNNKQNAITTGSTAQYLRGDLSLATLSSTVVPEGTNLYFTDARADARITAQKAANNGLATLDGSGKVPQSQLPGSVLGSTYTKNDLNTTTGNKCTDIAAAVQGDICIANSENKTYVLGTAGGTVAANWTQLLFPISVTSVNGQTGVVSLNTSNISESTNLYYTDARARSAISVSGTPLTYNATTGVLSINAANTTTSGFLSSTDWNTFNNKLGTTLTSGNIFVGNASNVATSLTLSGDATLSNAGALTIANGAINSAKILDGTIATADIANNAVDLTTKVTGILPTANGGTGLNTIGTANQVLAVNGTATGLQYVSIPSAPVSSVFGRTGTITAANGDYSTDQVTEGTTNKYYTDARVRAALSVSGTPLTYNSTTGAFGINTANTTTAGFLTAADWNTFNGKANAGANSNITSLTGLTTALSIAQGGTGSSTQNFVDLTTAQTIAGNKTFNGNTAVSGANTFSVGTGLASFGGNATIAGTLAVTGNQTNTGSLSVGTSLTVTGASTFGNLLQINSGNNLYFYNNTNTFYTRLRAGANTANATFTLPLADGTAGQVLSTDGAGQLSFASALTNTLTAGNILVGNASNVATSVALSGEGTISNAGVFSLGSTIAGAKTFSGAQTLTATGTALSVTNNATIGGTLGVTGATTLSGTLAVTGNQTNSGTLAVTKALSLLKGTDYSTTGSANDVALGNASLIRLTGSSAQTLTGIVAGSDGQTLTLVNAAAQAATLSNNSASSTAANRIITGTGSDLSLAAGASVQMIYDSGASVWRVVGGTGSGGGGGTSAPTVDTIAISSPTSTGFTSGGNITSNGGSTITASGVVWSTSGSPTLPTTSKTVDTVATGPFTSVVTGLTTNTTYYVRAYATNANGTTYGNQITVTPNTASQTSTFNYTGSVQTFVVPTGVTTVNIDAFGAQGNVPAAGNASGGQGGRVTASTYSVTPGETLYIYVGGQNGYNGGGNGFYGTGSVDTTSNGGGASDVRQGGFALSNRIIVAGGGGGNTSNAPSGGPYSGGVGGAGTCGSNFCGGGVGGAYGGQVGTVGGNSGGAGANFTHGGGGGGGGFLSGGGGATSTYNVSPSVSHTAGSGTLGQGGSANNEGGCSGVGSVPGGGGGYYGGGAAAGGNCGSGGGGAGSSWSGSGSAPVFNSSTRLGNGTVSVSYTGPAAVTGTNSAGVVIGSTLDYVNAVTTAATTLTSGQPIPVVTQAGNIQNTGGVFTLSAGKTYRLTGSVGATTTNNPSYQWRNITSGTLIGNAARALTPDSTTNFTNTGIAEAVITPTVTTTVQLEAINPSTFGNVSGSVGQGVVTIQQIGSTTAFTGGFTTTLDKLLGGGAINVIDSGNFGQTWNWTTATTQNGLTLGASALTTGTLLNLNNTSTANTGLTINAAGSVAFKRGADFTTTGTTNNADFGNASLIRLTGASAQTITGIAGGSDGELLTIVNAAAQAATITNNDAGSLAANRIRTGTGANVTLASDASISLVYDSGASVWRVVGGTGGSGGGASYSNVDVSNLATGGSIGSAATTVDVGTNFNINQTTAGQALTIPSPTNTTATKGKVITITNIGTVDFTIGINTIKTGGKSTAFVWSGTSWNYVTDGASASASTATTITYGETIAAGDLVEINSAGQARKIVQTISGTGNGVQTTGTSDVKTLTNKIETSAYAGKMVSKAIGTDKIVTLYKVTGTETLRAVIGTVSGTNTTWSTSETLIVPAASTVYAGGIADIGGGRIAFVYSRNNAVYAKVGTLSGTGASATITGLGAETQMDSGTFGPSAAVALNANKFMSCGKNDQSFGGSATIYCRVGSVDGSGNITFGTQHAINTQATGYHGNQFGLEQVGADQAILAFQENGGGGYRQVIHNLLVSGTSITSQNGVMTSANCNASSTCYDSTIAKIDTNRFIVEEFRSNSTATTNRRILLVTINPGSSTAPTIDATLNITNGDYSQNHSGFSPSTNVYVSNTENQAGTGYYSIYTISGNTITTTTAQQTWYSGTYPTSGDGNRRILTGFSGKVVSVSVNTAQNLNSRILQMGNSTTVSPSTAYAIAQTGGASGATGTIILPGQTYTGSGYTPGTLYYVQPNGTIGATPSSYLLGRAISSTQLNLSSDAFATSGAAGVTNSSALASIADPINGNTGVTTLESGFDYDRIRFTNNGTLSAMFNEFGQLLVGNGNTAGAGLVTIDNGTKTTTGLDIQATGSLGTNGAVNINVASGLKNIQFQVGGVAAGNITSTGAATAYNTSSDERLKADTGLTAKGLNDLLKIDVKNFKWLSTGETQDGFFAQQLYSVLPEAVTKGSDEKDKNGNLINPWSVDYGRVTPILVKGVQDLNTKVDNQFSAIESKVQNGFVLTDGNFDKINGALEGLNSKVTGLAKVSDATATPGTTSLTTSAVDSQIVAKLAPVLDRIKAVEDKNTAQDTAITDLKTKVDSITTTSGLTDAQVDAKLAGLGLAKLAGDQTFTGVITFAKDAVFKSDVDVLKDLSVGGKLIVGKDVIDQVIVKTTTTETKVKFTVPFVKAPVVTATRDQKSTDAWDAIDYRIVDVTPTGYTLQMKVAPTVDTTFNTVVIGTK
jgi:Collagen triple helix repeat (20 copies)/Chaperone of endosialidase